MASSILARNSVVSRAALAALVRRVEAVRQIRTALLDASYPRDVRIAKETLLFRTNPLIQALVQLLQNRHLAGGWEALLHDSVREAALKTRPSRTIASG